MVQKLYFKALVSILVVLFALPVTAQVGGGGTTRGPYYFEETFFPVYVNRNDTRSNTAGGEVATESGFGYDFRTTIGYVFWDQMLVGLTYNMYTLKTDQGALPGAPGRDEKTSTSEFGPSVGYTWGGMRFVFTYFFSGARTQSTRDFDTTATTADITTKNSDISGFQFLMGYTFPIAWGIEAGPSLVYKQVSFSKQSREDRVTPALSIPSTTLDSAKLDTSIEPMISLLVRF